MAETIGEPDDIEKQLEALCTRASELIDTCRYKTSYELFSQLRRRAKQEEQVYFYIVSVFYMMSEAQYLLNFQAAREHAIELISLLESDEQCRAIQPNMELPVYETLVYQFSSCAYDNLAEATGQLQGYNSEGMQACIADGLHICRQTGKLSCIGCFREYSSEVYLAADDAEMASYQCSQILDEETPPSDRGDRRWVAKRRLARVALLDGKLSDARQMCSSSMELAKSDGVTQPLKGQIQVYFDSCETAITLGEPEPVLDPKLADAMPADVECPEFVLRRDLVSALRHTTTGKYDAAADILRDWDQDLQHRSANHLWFEVRLRLIANSLLSDKQRLAERLSAQLQKQASAASDWLTLRRLTALQDQDFPTSPIAAYSRNTSESGETAEVTAIEDLAPSETQLDVNSDDDVDETNEVAAKDEEPKTPLHGVLQALSDRMQEMESDQVLEQLQVLRADVMKIDVSTITDSLDGCGLLHLMSYALGDHEDAAHVWRWANELTNKFDSNPAALSLLGDIGNRIRFGPNTEFGKTITADRLEPLFRKAMQQSDVGPRTYLRAGDHFSAEDNYGDAERSYARGFRLDRTVGELAMRLAELYRNSDRPRDALHVLDLCLREGSDEPALAWEAGMHAFGLQRYEVMRTYFEKFVSSAGEQPWVHYYNAIGYCDQGELELALQEIDAEQKLLGESAFHIDMVKGTIFMRLERIEEGRLLLDQSLDNPLFGIDNVTDNGLAGLLQRALLAISETEPELQRRMLERLLESGLAGEEVYEIARDPDTEPQKVNFYRVLVEQPLDERWTEFLGRLAHQLGWEAYFVEWGVLAEDEDQAEAYVLNWQNRCYPLPAQVKSIELNGDGFLDHPGVVWQGTRISSHDFKEEFGDFDQGMLGDLGTE